MLANRMMAAATPKATQGQQAYTTAGTYTFTVPAGATSVSVVCVGGGRGGTSGQGGAGGNGGALSYKNSITVSAGQSWTVVVGDKSNGSTSGSDAAEGGDSYFQSPSLSVEVRAKGGGSSSTNIGTSNNGGPASSGNAQGGAGAGGYSGGGGTGGLTGSSGSSGAGGGGGGGGGGGYFDNSPYFIEIGSGGGGGGVGILGSGSNGSGGAGGSAGNSGSAGGGGSSGSNGSGSQGGAYGGGGGQGYYYTDGAYTEYLAGGNGGVGAVRIIWGAGRSYPSNAANV